MTVLAFGGEMGFFIPGDSTAQEGTSVVTGAVGSYGSAFARCYTLALGSTSFLETPTVAAQADLWVHFEMAQGSVSSTAGAVRLVEFLDNGGIAQLRLTGSYISGGADGVWQMEKWTGSAWTALGSFNASAAALQTIDVHIVSNTASGTVDFYVAGTKRIHASTDLSGFTGITQAIFYGVTRGIRANICYSQVILATASTIGKRVGTIVMTGQGSTHTFTTGGFGNIDEVTYSDADIINSDTANQVELFTGTPVPSFSTYVIRAIGIYARTKKESTGPAQIQLALRSAGTTYFSSTIALDFGYGAVGNVWETNPATSAAFLSSEIPALEYGVKSIT